MPGSGEPQGRSATFDRSVVLSQLLFGVVLVVVVFTLQLLAVTTLTQWASLAGVALAFVTTGVTIFVPWHRLPRDLVMIVPVLDIVAVALVRTGDPASGLGLLWVFPTIWLASYFGLRGVILAVVLTSVAVWISEIIAERAFSPASIAGVVLLPIALVFVATSAFLTSRRTSAQRVLLRTQTRQLERALRRANRQEALLADVLNAVDFGVIRLAKDGGGAIMNRAYARLYRLDVADPGSARGGVAFGPDRVTPLPEDELPFTRAASGEEFDDVVTWVPDGTGGLRALAVTARRLHDEDGEVDGSVLVARDVTVELRAVRARDDLVASVSHELRTPMTSVLGYVDLSLEDPEVPEGVRRNLQIMERNGERMLELISTILQGARQSGGPEPLQREQVDLGALVVEAVEALRPTSDERGIRVTVTAAEPVNAAVDGFRIRQVVDNLLSNAIKYNRDGGEVSIGVTADGGTAWIVVRDTGIGIPEGELPRVFDRFYRADGVRQGSEHGNGLGLGITREIVERHGGTIDIDSQAGVGTTVIVRLPIADETADDRKEVS